MTPLLIIWPLIKQFWKPIAIVLIVIGLYLFGYMRGDAHRDRIWQAKIDSERRSQTMIANAHEALAIKDLEELRTKVEERDAFNNELLAKIEADANAARVCLGTDSLQRINRGRKSRP